MEENKEFKEMAKEKICEWNVDGNQCPSGNVVGITRCKLLCKTHFHEVRRDNKKRFNKGEDIPRDLIFIKTPGKISWSKYKESNQV